MSNDLVLRDYQEQIIPALHHGFKSGHKSQILYLPTGGGKTEIAIAMLKAAADRGNRAAMVLDRRVLCDQTSQRLERYEIDHGVMMAGHWRYHTYKSIQICSAQTLEKRGSFPGLKLLIVDECHSTRDQTKEFIKNNPDIFVVGLSASPFTKGLGKIYSNVVNGPTTKQLVDMGMLAPLRVFIAKEIDMSGAKKVAGEWSQSEATERGIKITGDIVNEWIKKTHEIFGEPKKTIVFCAGVAHGLDLSEKFKQAGYNFVSISYKDDDEAKKEALIEFSKPDSTIHGLIATDILTKGFDCIQEGSRVLTNRGLVFIEEVKLCDKIWDGYSFVSHGGAIYKGIRDVITYAGLTATRDHLVKTKEGWRTFGECSDQQISIITTGISGNEIQECENYFTGVDKSPRKIEVVESPFLQVRMRKMWDSIIDCMACFKQSRMGRVFELQGFGKSSDLDSKKSSDDEKALRESKGQGIFGLWRERNKVSFQITPLRSRMDSKKPRDDREKQRDSVRQNRQQWALRAWKFALGKQVSEWFKYSFKTYKYQVSCFQDGSPRSQICGQNSKEFNELRVNKRTNNREIQQEVGQTKRRVWDILNCGPRNSFTCEGLLVHNCADVMIGVSARPFTKSFSSHVQQLGRVMRPHGDKSDAIWLDHSGNFLRFADDWEELYNEGVKELDDGKEKPKPEPTEKEKEAAKCSNCGQIWGPLDVCQHCGHVRPRKNTVLAVPGELHEIRIGKSKQKAANNAKELYAMCCSYARQHSSPEKQKFRAAYIYKDIMGEFPPKDFVFEKTKSELISNAVLNQIKRRNIAFSRAAR